MFGNAASVERSEDHTIEISIEFARGYCVDPVKQILASAPSSIDAKDNLTRKDDSNISTTTQGSCTNNN
jgi:hypothetical protein